MKGESERHETRGRQSPTGPSLSKRGCRRGRAESGQQPKPGPRRQRRRQAGGVTVGDIGNMASLAEGVSGTSYVGDRRFLAARNGCRLGTSIMGDIAILARRQRGFLRVHILGDKVFMAQG